MSNEEFFSKIVTGIRNFFNFTQRNSEFLSSKIPPHPPITKFLSQKLYFYLIFPIQPKQMLDKISFQEHFKPLLHFIILNVFLNIILDEGQNNIEISSQVLL